jgi:signal transduction histidine kinase
MVALRREGDFAVIEVSDQGCGMTRTFIETELFKPFSSTKKTGFGIGMYQCRDWMQRWGGRLEVDSEPGQGTTVRMVLPLLPAAATVDVASTNDLQPVGERAA